MPFQCTSFGEGFPDPQVPLTARLSPAQPLQGQPFDFIVEATLQVCGTPMAALTTTGGTFRIELSAATCSPDAGGAPIPYNYRCTLPSPPLRSGEYGLDVQWVGYEASVFQGGFVVTPPVPVPLEPAGSFVLAVALCLVGLPVIRRRGLLSANLSLHSDLRKLRSRRPVS